MYFFSRLAAQIDAILATTTTTNTAIAFFLLRMQLKLRQQLHLLICLTHVDDFGENDDDVYFIKESWVLDYFYDLVF